MLLRNLTRGIYGTFQFVSEQHLQGYVDGEVFRWSNRQSVGVDDFERAEMLL